MKVTINETEMVGEVFKHFIQTNAEECYSNKEIETIYQKILSNFDVKSDFEK